LNTAYYNLKYLKDIVTNIECVVCKHTKQSHNEGRFNWIYERNTHVQSLYFVSDNRSLRGKCHPSAMFGFISDK